MTFVTFCAGLICVAVSLLEAFQHYKYRPLRAGIFTALGLWGVIPAVHAWHELGHVPQVLLSVLNNSWSSRHDDAIFPHPIGSYCLCWQAVLEYSSRPQGRSTASLFPHSTRVVLQVVTALKLDALMGIVYVVSGYTCDLLHLLPCP